MGVFDNIKYMLQAMSKDKLPLNDLNRGGYIKPIDALLGRKPMDYDIMLGGETAREQEYYKRIGALTADTNKAITFGSPRYIGGVDPETIYYTYGNQEGPKYENIPSGYGVEEGTRSVDTIANIEKRKILKGVKKFITTQYPGTRVTPEYFDALASKLDQDTLLRALAMSIAETGAGRDAVSFKKDGKLKVNNFYGYHKGGNTYDPDLDTMIQDLNTAFGPEGRYSTINKDTLSGYVRGKGWNELTPEQQQGVLDELSRYNWARSKFGL